MVTSVPSRLTSALPMGMRYSSSGYLLAEGLGAEHLVFQHHHWVVVADGAFHEALGVVGGGGHEDLEAGDVDEEGVGALGVLGCGGAAGTDGGAEDDGEGRLAAEHVVNLGHLVDDLVHGGEGEGHHAGADDGAEACAGSADGGSHVGGLGDGADADALLAEFGDQGGQGAESAAEVEHLGVAAHLFAEGFDGGLGVGQFRHDVFLTPILTFPDLEGEGTRLPW